MKCVDIMTKSPECCDLSTTVDLVAQLMELRDIGPVPVVDTLHSKTLVGIVTDRDLALKVVGKGKNPQMTPVSEVMSKDVITCRPTDEVDLAVRMMEQWQVRRIPVVAEHGELIGIIAQGDIATRLRDAVTTQEVVERVSRSH